MLSAELDGLRAVDLGPELKGFDRKALAVLVPAEDAKRRLTTRDNPTSGGAGPYSARRADTRSACEPARERQPASAG